MTRYSNGDLQSNVDWIVPADIAILDFLYAARTPHGSFAIQTPQTIAANIDYSRKHVSTRCRELADRGLLERVGHGEYRLSHCGRIVVEGEVSYEVLDDLDAENGGEN